MGCVFFVGEQTGASARLEFDDLVNLRDILYDDPRWERDERGELHQPFEAALHVIDEAVWSSDDDSAGACVLSPVVVPGVIWAIDEAEAKWPSTSATYRPLRNLLMAASGRE